MGVIESQPSLAFTQTILHFFSDFIVLSTTSTPRSTSQAIKIVSRILKAELRMPFLFLTLGAGEH